MAEAPSFKISTRAMAPSGIELRSTALPEPPWVAMRRPFNNTRVLLGPRPRSEAKDAPPLTRSASAPNTLLPDVALSAPAPLAEMVRISCSALVMPCFCMSSKVMTWMGKAPSLAIRLMLEPVISTRWLGCDASTTSWAAAGPTTPIRAIRWAIFFNFKGVLLGAERAIQFVGSDVIYVISLYYVYVTI